VVAKLGSELLERRAFGRTCCRLVEQFSGKETVFDCVLGASRFALLRLSDQSNGWVLAMAATLRADVGVGRPSFRH